MIRRKLLKECKSEHLENLRDLWNSELKAIWAGYEQKFHFIRQKNFRTYTTKSLKNNEIYILQNLWRTKIWLEKYFNQANNFAGFWCIIKNSLFQIKTIRNTVSWDLKCFIVPSKL